MMTNADQLAQQLSNLILCLTKFCDLACHCFSPATFFLQLILIYCNTFLLVFQVVLRILRIQFKLGLS